MNARRAASAPVLGALLVTLVGAVDCGALAAVPARAAPTTAPDAPPSTPLIWTVRGPQGALTLMGSIHALRAEDHPLPAGYDAAYAAAARLVLEVELDAPGVPVALRQARARGTLPPGRTLRDEVGESGWREARRLAAAATLDLAPHSGQEPWLAALDLTVHGLQAAGLDARQGVDSHYLARARADHKPVLALEDIASQFAPFDALPAAEQRQLLLATLRELPDERRLLDALVGDWQRGDLAALARWQDELATTPRLRAALFAARHARWLPQLEAWLAEPIPTLVIVGAEHLVGAGSVLELLAARGYTVERVAPR